MKSTSNWFQISFKTVNWLQPRGVPKSCDLEAKNKGQSQITHTSEILKQQPTSITNHMRFDSEGILVGWRGEWWGRHKRLWQKCLPWWIIFNLCWHLCILLLLLIWPVLICCGVTGDHLNAKETAWADKLKRPALDAQASIFNRPVPNQHCYRDVSF